MDFKLSISVNDQYKYPDFCDIKSGLVFVCTDFVLRDKFLMIKDPEIILKNDVRDLGKSFYISLNQIQDFSVDTVTNEGIK